LDRIRLVYGNDYYDKIQALADGEVQPDGIELISVRYPAQELFYRVLKYDEFDVAEMSFTSFLIARAHGRDNLLALPVFASRRFFHVDVVCNVNAGISAPADLAGKRFGTPEFQMSLAVWTRSTLQRDFSVQPESITWYLERSEELSHGGASGGRLPPGVPVRRLRSDQSLSEMLLAGELDAGTGLGLRTALDRSGGTSLTGRPEIRKLFDYREESARFFRAHGYIPPNHVVVVKHEVVREHPWIAMSLYNAFEASKAAYYRQLQQQVGRHWATGHAPRFSHLLWVRQLVEEQNAMFGPDISPFGMRANRQMIEDCLDILHEQGLTESRLQAATCFAEGVLET
jgi:4,5-dihydroxyphthalate decarboxylase